MTKSSYTRHDPETERERNFTRQAIRDAYPKLAHLVDLALATDLRTWNNIIHSGLPNMPTPENPDFVEHYLNDHPINGSYHNLLADKFLIPAPHLFWVVRNGDVAHLRDHNRMKWLPTKVYDEMVDLGYLPQEITYEDGTRVLYKDDPTNPIKVFFKSQGTRVEFTMDDVSNLLETYAVTKEFEKEVEKLLSQTEGDQLIFSLGDICDIFQTTVGEYEHGTADVEDCQGVTLKQYKEVTMDLLRTLSCS